MGLILVSFFPPKVFPKTYPPTSEKTQIINIVKKKYLSITKTLKQIISEGGKKFMGLLLILVIPGFIYLFISKADNNFMTLSFVGPKEHVIPDFSFVNQNNELITNDDYRGNIYVANFYRRRC